ncbi:hypothetical protein JP74_21340 [Devosia sp. 17-2-E-8]|nr:hypothetical protein JP74_21340 [Devosia sp. 17-2-E-8]
MTRILSGTAAVLAGFRAVAFIGDPLSDANCPVDGTVVLGGAAYFIASRTDTSHFELTRDYEGVDGTVSCEIDPLNANAINLVKVARSITEYNAKLALTDAYGKGLFYECTGLTGANDPGPGKLARNAAAWADTTEIYMDVLDAGGHEQGALIDLAKTGTVYIVRSIDTGAYAAFLLSAGPENMGPDEWRKVTLEYVDGDGIIGDGELVAVEWNRSAEGLKIDFEDVFAGRAAYDAAAGGFMFLSLNGANGAGGPAVLYRKRSVAAGDWSPPIPYQGPEGGKGDPGPYTELTFGPVTTVPYGQPAAVNAVIVDVDTVRLDFSIPAGQDGAGTGDMVGPTGGVTDGAPVLFSGAGGKLTKAGAFATKGQAEGGTDTAVFMNPLNTAQAIAAAPRQAGSLVQMVKTITISATAVSSTMTLTDTTPVNTNGTQIMAVAITPKKVGNKIRGTVNIWGGATGVLNLIAMAFVDNSANALTARAQTVAGAYAEQMSFEFDFNVATLDTRTFAVRLAVSTGTFTLNGLSSGRLWGGVAQCSIALEEIAS